MCIISSELFLRKEVLDSFCNFGILIIVLIILIFFLKNKGIEGVFDMDNCLFRAKQCSLKYGEEILKLLYEKTKLFHQEICNSLSLRPPSLNAIMNKMLEEELVIKENVGKNVYYYLPEKVNDSIAKELNGEKKNNELIKVIFLNILRQCKANPYASYLLKNIEYTFNVFDAIELIMLLFILGIYNYEEGQSFSILFNLSNEEATQVQQDLLNRFQRFLFYAVGKEAPDNKEREL